MVEKYAYFDRSLALRDDLFDRINEILIRLNHHTITCNKNK